MESENTEIPKRRGRPAGSKNKPKEQEAPEEPQEPEEAENSKSEVPPIKESIEESAPVVEQPSPKPKVSKAPKPKAPKPQAPKEATVIKTPAAPTATEIASELFKQIDDRQYNRTMQRRALYSSWI